MKVINERRTSVFSPTGILKLTLTLGLGALMLFVATDGRLANVTVANAASADEWKLPPDAKAMKNAQPSNPASIAKGKAVYDKQCASCHGLTGDGNTPVGLKLKTPDLRNKSAMGKFTDGEVFAMISVGNKPKMPAFDPKIPKDDRWHTVNYVRSLGK